MANLAPIVAEGTALAGAVVGIAAAAFIIVALVDILSRLAYALGVILALSYRAAVRLWKIDWNLMTCAVWPAMVLSSG